MSRSTPQREPLTNRQAEILEFIKNYSARFNVAPTMQEIADEFGFASPNAAQQHVDALLRKGWVAIRRRSGTSGKLGSIARGLMVL